VISGNASASTVMESPNRHSICYAVRALIPDPAKTFQIMVKDLREQKEN